MKKKEKKGVFELSYLQNNIIIDIESQGIIPRIVSSIFSRISQDTASIKYTVIVSIAEIYKESIRDLLDTKKDNLKIIKTAKNGTKI